MIYIASWGGDVDANLGHFVQHAFAVGTVPEEFLAGWTDE